MASIDIDIGKALCYEDHETKVKAQVSLASELLRRVGLSCLTGIRDDLQ
jgi:hypothetical protein